jgi:hypothetical protein
MADQTGHVSRALIDRVILQEEFVVFWDAFQDLRSTRCAGLSLGPIPWTSIDRWAARHNIYDEAFDMLCDCVQAMDMAWLNYKNEKTPKA